MSNQNICKSIGIPLGSAVQLGFGMVGVYLDQRWYHFNNIDLEGGGARMEHRAEGQGHILSIMNLLGTSANIGISYLFQRWCPDDTSDALSNAFQEEHLQKSVVGEHNTTQADV